jgi:hypothetical protein
MMCFTALAVTGLAKRFNRASMVLSCVVAGGYTSSTKKPPCCDADEDGHQSSVRST